MPADRGNGVSTVRARGRELILGELVHGRLSECLVAAVFGANRVGDVRHVSLQWRVEIRIREVRASTAGVAAPGEERDCSTLRTLRQSDASTAALRAAECRRHSRRET